MPTNRYGIPLDMYGDDPELDPFTGSGIARPPPPTTPSLGVLEPDPVETPAAGGASPKVQSEILRLRDELMPRKSSRGPSGYGRGLGDADLAEAQSQDRKSQGWRDISAGLSSAFGRTPLRKDDGGTPDASALLQRRGAMDDESARMATQAKAQSAAEENDPRSEASLQAQALLKRLHPELAAELGGRPMSAAQINKSFPWFKEYLESDRANAKAKATAAEAQAKLAEDLRRREENRKHALADTEAANTFRAGESRLQRAQSAANARTMAGYREDADVRREEQRIAAEKRKAEKGTTIPGLEVVDGAEPTIDDAKKVKLSLAAAERMGRYVDELEALHSQYGTELTGPAAAQMGSLVSQIDLEAKNIGELGALSGPDMGLVEKIRGGADPSSIGANLKSVVGVDNTGASLQGLRKWVKDTTEGNKKVYGYRSQAPTAPGGAPQGKVRVRDASGRTGWADPNKPLPPGVTRVPNG